MPGFTILELLLWKHNGYISWKIGAPCRVVLRVELLNCAPNRTSVIML